MEEEAAGDQKRPGANKVLALIYNLAVRIETYVF
jgi:hypothetical protein